MRLLTGLLVLGVAGYVAAYWAFASNTNAFDDQPVTYLDPPALVPTPARVTPPVASQPLPLPATTRSAGEMKADLAGGGRDEPGEPASVSMPAMAGSGLVSPDATVRAIQKGLKLAGCYPGIVDGDWSLETRRAMQRYLAELNASLPVSRPEEALRASIEAHPDLRCGPPTRRAPETMTVQAPPSTVPQSVQAEDAQGLTPPPSPALRHRFDRTDHRWATRRFGNPHATFFEQMMGGG